MGAKVLLTCSQLEALLAAATLSFLSQGNPQKPCLPPYPTANKTKNQSYMEGFRKKKKKNRILFSHSDFLTQLSKQWFNKTAPSLFKFEDHSFDSFSSFNDQELLKLFSLHCIHFRDVNHWIKNCLSERKSKSKTK